MFNCEQMPDRISSIIVRLRSVAQANRRSIAANTVFLIANTLAGSLFGFVFWVVTARIYSASEVGMGAAYVSAAASVATIGQMGLGAALIRFTSTMGTERVRFTNSALTGGAVTTLLAAGIFVLGIPIWSENLGELAKSAVPLMVFFVTAPAISLGKLIDSAYVAHEATYLVPIRNLLAMVTRLLLLILVGPLLGATGVLLAHGGAGIIAFVVGAFVFLPRVLPGYRPRPTFAWQTLRGGATYTLGNHIALFLWDSPTLLYPILIAGLFGAEQNAYFYMSWMIANLIFIVPNSSALSALARASNQPDCGDRTLWMAMRRTLLAVVPLAAISALAVNFVLEIFGASYAVAGFPLYLCLMLSVVPYTINTFVMTSYRIGQNTRALLFYSVTLCLLSLVLGVAMAWHAGLVGLGLGWLSANALCSILALWTTGAFRRALARALSSYHHREVRL